MSRPSRLLRSELAPARSRLSTVVRVAAVLLAASLLVGCKSVPKPMGQFEALSKPAEGQGLLYVLRKKQFVGGGIWLDLFIGGRRVGYLSNGTFDEIELPPGKYTLTNEVHPGIAMKPPALEFELAAGQVRYYQLDIVGADVMIIPGAVGPVVAPQNEGYVAWIELEEAEAVSMLFFLQKSAAVEGE